MRSFITTLVFASLALTFSAGCARHGSVGDSCQAPGLGVDDFEQCASGFICTPAPSGSVGSGNSAHWDTATCRTVCSSNYDCAAVAHTICRPVAGADYAMACQPE